MHRGTFRSANDLNTKTRAFIDGCNERCHPFAWTSPPRGSSTRRTAQQLRLRATSRSQVRG
jgi:hypothetical protein